MFNVNTGQNHIKSFEHKFNKLCDPVEWTTDFENELDPDEQWEMLRGCMLEAVSEILAMREGHTKSFLISNIDDLLMSIFVEEMNEWLPYVS